MVNEEYFKILQKGVGVWNEWRKRNPGIVHPDLRVAELGGADLRRAELRSAELFGADLSGADLTGANLFGANLTWANLSGTNLEASRIGRTLFGDVDLSATRGLETVQHAAPSTIGIDTIFRSGGKIPEVFLRGAGLPEPFIANVRALVEAIGPVQFYSCFISYSSKDEQFAKRLYTDLQQRNVRCWFAAEDMRIGDRIRLSIDEAIRMHDKLLLVLTESSVRSAWVEKEVETAFEKERKQGRTVLFPIRLDDAVMNTDQAWAADVRRTRHVGDFREWKNQSEYREAFERLMRDLESES